MARWKARDFHVVPQRSLIVLGRRAGLPVGIVSELQFRVFEGRGGTHRMTAEELLLVVVPGSPGQHIANCQSLTTDMTNHGFWRHTFGRQLIVSATRRVQMSIAGIPAPLGRVDPALQAHVNARMTLVDADRL